MRHFRQYALRALLFGSLVPLFTIAAHACVVIPTPIGVQPTFSVHIYNDLGPVVGLKLKIVTLEDRNPLAEATTDDKGIALFQLKKYLKGSDLFLQPDHQVMGWQWPELHIETDAAKSAIEIPWPSRVLRSRELRGTIRLRDFANPPEVGPLRGSLTIRSLVSYQEIATVVTDEKGAFQFAGIKPGLYYLQVNGNFKSDTNVPQGNIPVFIGNVEANGGLSIITRYSDCGLEYESGKEGRP